MDLVSTLLVRAIEHRQLSLDHRLQYWQQRLCLCLLLYIAGLSASAAQDLVCTWRPLAQILQLLDLHH